jgi:hypothetical protein
MIPLCGTAASGSQSPQRATVPTVPSAPRMGTVFMQESHAPYCSNCSISLPSEKYDSGRALADRRTKDEYGPLGIHSSFETLGTIDIVGTLGTVGTVPHRDALPHLRGRQNGTVGTVGTPEIVGTLSASPWNCGRRAILRVLPWSMPASPHLNGGSDGS